jgi:hypothetical protein
MLHAQELTRHSRPTFIVGVSFHAVSTPFHKPWNNFRNLGFKVGAEVPWSSEDNLRQSIELGYYVNRLNGRSVYVHSDLVYRPKMMDDVRADLRIGPGLGFIVAPGETYVQKNGLWTRSRGGKWFPQVHAGVGVTYNDVKVKTVEASPFLQYEVMAVVGYNRGIPVLPNSFIHVGSKMKF